MEVANATLAAETSNEVSAVWRFGSPAFWSNVWNPTSRPAFGHDGAYQQSRAQ